MGIQKSGFIIEMTFKKFRWLRKMRYCLQVKVFLRDENNIYILHKTQI